MLQVLLETAGNGCRRKMAPDSQCGEDSSDEELAMFPAESIQHSDRVAMKQQNEDCWSVPIGYHFVAN